MPTPKHERVKWWWPNAETHQEMEFGPESDNDYPGCREFRLAALEILTQGLEDGCIQTPIAFTLHYERGEDVRYALPELAKVKREVEVDEG